MKTAERDMTARKFLFDHSFDVERKSARKRKAEEEKPPEPTFSKEELEAARQDGYAEGRAAGAQEAKSGLEAATADVVEEICRQLPALSTDQSAANDRLMHDGAKVATTIARKILPSYTARHGTDELTALVTRSLQSLVDQPKIIVCVSPSQMAPITEHLEAAASASGFDGRFLVEANETMGPSDCRVTWQGGGLERCEPEIWQQIDSAIEEYLGATSTVEDAAPKEPESDTPAMETVSTMETEPGTENLASDGSDNDGSAPADTNAEIPGPSIETTTEMPTEMPDPLEDR